MIQKINGEQPFQILSDAFTIGPSQTGYDLQISANGTDYSTLFSVAANTTRLVNNVSNGAFFRLKNNVGDVDVNWRTTCKSGGSGGGSYVLPTASETTLGGVKVGEGLSIDGNGVLSSQGGGSIDSGAVLSLVNSAITDFSNDLQEGEPIVGMAKQLYSPDGVTSEGAFAYRTTAGDADVSSGIAELRKIGGNSIYPELQYNDSAALERGGEAVTGFTYDIEWGDNSEWVAVQGSDSFSAKKVRIKDPSGYPGVWLSNGRYYQLVRSGGNTYGTWNRMTDISGDGTRFLMDDNLGEAYVDEDYIVFEVYDDNVWVAVSLCDANAGQGAAVFSEIIIPNDIPVGESTYIFAIDENNVLGSWTPSLPQAIRNMQIDGSDYEPQDGDEITITRSAYAEEVARHSFPEKFVALGLNSFDKDVNERPEGWVSLTQLEDNGDDTYTVTINAVTDLNDGYVIYSETSAITEVTMIDEWGQTLEDREIDDKVITGETVSIAYPYTTPEEEGGAFKQIRITTTDIDTLCVHPRWSGYRDEDYEPYTESVVDLYDMVGEGDGEIIEGGFYPRDYMWSVGNVRNTVDLVNNTFTMYVKQSEYSQEAIEQLIEDGKVLGTDFDFDDSNIYEVMDEPMIYNNLSGITTYKYTANDFSVEYWVDIDSQTMAENKIGCENYYMNNLVDKLRRMESVVVNLTDLSSEGEEGKLYNYNGRLLKWVNGEGNWGEWYGSHRTGTQYASNGYSEYAVLKYSTLPAERTFLCNITRIGTKYNYLVWEPSSNKLVSYSDTGYTNVYAEVALGSENVNISQASQKVYVSWADGIINFNIDNYAGITDLCSTSVSTAHYEEVENGAVPMNMSNDTYDGIPVWDKQGIIIGKRANCSNKTIYFNTTGYIGTIFATIDNGNGPTRMFVPTQAGTSGQLLLSSGGGEPTWTNWIKSVQITSNAYDALVQAGTTDPNTLYLLVD